MTPFNQIILAFACLFPAIGIAQDKLLPEHKVLQAVRTSASIAIDGQLTEPAWQTAALADDFTEFRPVIGKKWDKAIRTEGYLLYDDAGIYFAGHCYENTTDSISRELAGRDGFGNNDYIGIIFDTYEDKLNGFEYFVTPLNEQWDAKSSANGEDFSWNAVWKSATNIHEKGWDFEMFIPYAAIRFAEEDIQNWGLQITRRRRKTEQQTCWNFFNPNVNGFLTQEGTWQGLKNIKPPFRLQLFPYLSYYQNHFPTSTASTNGWSQQIAGGLDLKMGLNEAFTLDATLIPDFGQVQSDNKVLNLSPFEVKFNEFRTFFNEGTELFSKGDLFYSRRIGGSPINAGNVYENLKENEEIIENPAESKLINASKISGRTKKGLGIGFLNAITKATNALIVDKITGKSREVETDPLTNYNILVLDQNLKNNSSLSFINTSVLRQGQNYNANVSQLMTSLYDKKNTYRFTAAVGLSRINSKAAQNNYNNGLKYNWSFGKNSGAFTFDFSQERVDDKFNSNDLGYFTNNNYFDHNLFLSYRIQTPNGIYNKLFFNMGAWSSHLSKKIANIDKNYQNQGARLNINMQLKTLHWVGLFTNYRPKSNDFYEPRVFGQFFERGARYMAGAWIETNSNKKYSFNFETYQSWFINFYGGLNHNINFNNTYRFNPKFSLSYGTQVDRYKNGIGFNNFYENQALFGLRKVLTYDNVLSSKYNFNTKNWLTFRLRHYNSEVRNSQMFDLIANGQLKERTNMEGNINRNINYFNIDMVYTWQFAPGSFMNVVWKNNTYKSLDNANFRYFENLNETLKTDQNNNISVKIIYFFDYHTLVQNSKKKA